MPIVFGSEAKCIQLVDISNNNENLILLLLNDYTMQVGKT